MKKLYLLVLILLTISLSGQKRNSSKLVTQFIKTNSGKSTGTLAIASWNTQKIGKSKSTATINKMAKLLRNFDLIALQEVVAKDPAGAQKVAQLADALSRLGFKWDYQVSDPTMSSSANVRERYAFLWKTSRVHQVRRAYLDKPLQVVIDREPFIGEFKAKGSDKSFYLITFHARPITNQPEMEIVYLKNYPQRLKTNRFIITGDFNLDEKNPVWNSFYKVGVQSALKNSPTTLKRKCKNGVYLNHAFDNFYFGTAIKSRDAGRLNIVGSCAGLPEAHKLSDHLPIFMEFTVQN